MKVRYRPSLAVLVAFAGLVAAGCSSPATTESTGSEPTTLVIASWGGDFTEATRVNLAEPFTAETGIEVQIVDVPGTQATQMQQMVDAGDVQWDILDSLGAADAFYMAQEGLVQDLPTEMHSSFVETLGEGKVSDFGFTFANLGYVIACNADTVTTCPQTLPEYFDTEGFPGKRELPGEYYSQLAAALVAASGQDTQAEGIDWNSAVETLKAAAPEVTVWYTSGDQQEQVLSQGEADMGLIYSGRAYNLAKEMNLTINWGGVYDPGYTAIATGAPHQEAAEKFMTWVVDHPEAQAGFAEAMNYGVPSAEAIEMLPTDVASTLADYPDNFALLVQQNFPWYLANKDEVDSSIRTVVQG